jgi:hypothetical protein
MFILIEGIFQKPKHHDQTLEAFPIKLGTKINGHAHLYFSTFYKSCYSEHHDEKMTL